MKLSLLIDLLREESVSPLLDDVDCEAAFDTFREEKEAFLSVIILKKAGRFTELKIDNLRDVVACAVV